MISRFAPLWNARVPHGPGLLSCHLIRHGFAVPPSPQGEGKAGKAFGKRILASTVSPSCHPDRRGRRPRRPACRPACTRDFSARSLRFLGRNDTENACLHRLAKPNGQRCERPQCGMQRVELRPKQRAGGAISDALRLCFGLDGGGIFALAKMTEGVCSSPSGGGCRRQATGEGESRFLPQPTSLRSATFPRWGKDWQSPLSPPFTQGGLCNARP